MALTILVYPLWNFLKNVELRSRDRSKHRVEKEKENKKRHCKCKMSYSSYDRRSTKKKVANIYNFITPCVKFF